MKTIINNSNINPDIKPDIKPIMKTRKIVNVYKQNYINNIGMGLGDYIRGSFFLLEFCKENNIEFDLDFSEHPISKFLINQYNDTKIDYTNVLYFHNYNRNKSKSDIMDYINSNNNKIQYLFTNNHPQIDKITEVEKNIIKSKFIPNKELNNAIEETLNKLNLTKKMYKVIHIRIGDRYIIENKDVDNIILKDIDNIFKNIMFNGNEKYLLLSDSKDIKKILKNKYPFLIVQHNDIVHLAGNCSNDDALKNTMVDFFLISNANSILAMSIYGHMTGFSHYCSIINNIPINFIKLNNYFNQV
jgi:hypothetical protein